MHIEGVVFPGQDDRREYFDVYTPWFMIQWILENCPIILAIDYTIIGNNNNWGLLKQLVRNLNGILYI